MWKVCRACLVRGVKMESPEKQQLQRLFEIVTGLKMTTTIGLPHGLCTECGANLRRFSAFRSKCRRADAVLQSVYKANNMVITESDLTRIDRTKADLCSPLRVHRLESWEISPDGFTPPIKLEGENDCLEFLDDVIKKEEDTVVFSPVAEPSDSLLCDSDGSMKDEPLINYKKDPKKESKERKSKKKDRSIKNTKIKTKKQSSRDFDDFFDDDLLQDVINRSERKKHYSRTYYEEFSSIVTLTREQQIVEIEKRQHTPNYINSPFKCTLCYRGFVDDAAFTNHMNRHDPASGDFECDICRRRFKLLKTLRKHIAGNHVRQYSCKRCNNVCYNPCQARLHEMWHRGKSYQCPHCEEAFTKYTSYLGHVRKKHASQFVCPLCGDAFVSQKGIQQHKHLAHREDQVVPDDGPFCAECDVRFATDEAFNRHLACSANHLKNKERLKDCTECGQVFETLGDLRAHMQSQHGGVKPRPRSAKPTKQVQESNGFPKKCQLCEVRVDSGREYWQHFRRMHKDQSYPKEPGQYTCEVCGKGFKGLAHLSYHMRKHTGEKPFQCNECDKSFMLAEYLTRHKRVHTGEKRYPCSVCGKRYQTKSNLDKHFLIHTGEKRHPCEMCGKMFKVPYERRAHVEHVHFKKPWPKRERAGRRQRPAQDEPQREY